MLLKLNTPPVTAMGDALLPRLQENAGLTFVVLG